MFGFSLTKILILAVAVGVVWYGMKWLQSLPKSGGTGKKSGGSGDGAPDTIELKRDEATGDYVAVDLDDDRRT